MLENEYLEKPEKYYNGLRPEISDLVTTKVNRILDVGASSGNFAESLLLQSKCNEAYGIEPFPEAAKVAESRLTKVYHGGVEENIKNLENKFFDIIFFNDVLEHLQNPNQVLIDIKSKLTENGLIISSIPNVAYINNLYTLIFNQDWEYVDSGILDKTHLRFFTKKSILRMFDECGYNIDLIKGNPYCQKPLRKKFKIVNFFLKGKLNDSIYLNFLSIASKK